MSRKEAFALLFVTGLLLAGVAAPRSIPPRPFALQSACLFDCGAQCIDDGAAECALFQNLKATDG